MNSGQIAAVLQADRYTRPYFRGVFASDRLPQEIKRYPTALVMNVDPHEEPGSHWCSVFITKDKIGTFFDSYGQEPQEYTHLFQEFLERNCKSWTYNSKCLQSLDSNVCGHYSLYFLLLRSRNISVPNIVRRFSSNTRRNDQYVYHFIMRHYAFVLLKNKKHVNHQVSKSKNKRHK